jgi:hypothetical protein
VIKKGHTTKYSNRKLVNTVLYSDDQILMATSEDEFQKNGIPLESYTVKPVKLTTFIR